MAWTKTESTRSERHPWLTAFAANPGEETARLLAGFAAVDPYRRADAPDVASLLFGPLPANDPLRCVLGEALVAWLAERRRMQPEQRAAYGLDPFVREVSDAFRIVWRLELAEAARRLRDEFHEWDSWTRPLMLTPARDAHRAYLRLCALMQIALGDTRLEAVWLDLCRNAGRDLFDAYLDVGLLGLRRMPATEPGVEPARRVALGLAVWAAAVRPLHRDFMREWQAIKCLYPRAKSAWRDIVEAAIEAVEKEEGSEFPAAMWWRKDIGVANKPGGPQRRRAPAFVPPSVPAARDVAGRLKRGPLTDDILNDASRMIDERERYALVTGESSYFVKTACNFATQLLRHGKRGAEIAGHLARRALAWSSDDPTAWGLWHRALALQAERVSAELIGWEALRRVPDNVIRRTQLAQHLIADPTRHMEAEALLREAIERGPHDEHPVVLLAKLLAADPARRQEAEVLLRNWVRRRPTLHSRSLLARLLAADPARRQEAEALLREILRENEDNIVVMSTLAGVLLTRGENREAGELLDYVGRIKPSEHYFSLRARWAYQHGGAEKAREWLLQGLDKFPNNAQMRSKLDQIMNAPSSEEDAHEWLQNLIDADYENDFRTPWLNAGFDYDASDGGEADQEADASLSDFGISDGGVSDDFLEETSTSDRITRGPVARREARPEEASSEMPANIGGDTGSVLPEVADPVYRDALKYGRARRADFALNGAGLDETGRAQARADLEALLEEAPFFVYGHLIRFRRIGEYENDRVWQGLGRQDAAIIARAWRAGEVAVLDRLASQSKEPLLAWCAAALTGSGNARGAFAEALIGSVKAEGRGSRTLRKLLEVHLKAYSGPKLELASAERFLLEKPEIVEHALNEAIDASFDYAVVEV